MRARSTIIAVLVLLLAGCGLEPQIKPSDKAQLENLKGPEVGSIEATLVTQAQEAENAGDYNRAVQTYKQLIDKSPNNVEYMQAFASDLRRSGNPDAAILFEDKLLKKDPKNAAALEGKGLALMNKGDFKNAGKTFEEVMKLDPKRWRTLNGIGILFAMKGRNSDALAYYNVALDLSAENPSVLNNMGLTLAMDKQYDRAIETFQRAKGHMQENNPEIRSIDLNLSLVYAIAGRLDDAERTAAPHLSKAGLYNNMGFYAYLANNTDLAKGYLNMALTQSPVYYERAWKNLNAISGDADSSTPASATEMLGKNMPHKEQQSKKISSDEDDDDDKPAAKKKPKSVPKDNAIKLEDIPSPKVVEPTASDSDRQKSDDDKKDASPQKSKEDTD